MHSRRRVPKKKFTADALRVHTALEIINMRHALQCLPTALQELTKADEKDIELHLESVRLPKYRMA